jgi:glucose/mannose-6-phosphate isomerase
MNSRAIPNLDDQDEISKIDKNDMLGMIFRMPDHAKDALEIPFVDIGSNRPDLIAVLGMGGSAVSGDLLAAWLRYELDIPIIVVRGYDLPATVNANSLVIAVSFSGNTEETLSAFEQALARDANVITLSTGGLLEERAKAQNIPHIKITPTEDLVPRAAVAYLLFPLINILRSNKIIIRNDLEDELEEALTILAELSIRLGPETSTGENKAKQIALELFEHVPVVYTLGSQNVISLRWRTQLNENAKIIARNDELPEMNHNDIVGWYGDSHPDRFSVVLLRDPEDESERIAKRIKLTGELAFSKAGSLIEVHAEGKFKLGRMLSLMYIGDFTSAYLAVLRGIDPTPVEVIENLKKLMRG